jgi:hypothetical protein
MGTLQAVYLESLSRKSVEVYEAINQRADEQGNLVF